MLKDKIDGENDDLEKNVWGSSGNATYFSRDKNKIKRKIAMGMEIIIIFFVAHTCLYLLCKIKNGVITYTEQLKFLPPKCVSYLYFLYFEVSNLFRSIYTLYDARHINVILPRKIKLTKLR